MIKNIEVTNGVEYTFSLKIGYKQHGALPTDINKGFGLVILTRVTEVDSDR